MVGIFISGVDPFQQTVNMLSTEGSMRKLVKNDQTVSEKKTFIDYIILNIYPWGEPAGAYNCKGTKFWL